MYLYTSRQLLTEAYARIAGLELRLEDYRRTVNEYDVIEHVENHGTTMALADSQVLKIIVHDDPLDYLRSD